MRGDGGYAILPDGDQRQWFPGLSPDETELAEIPDWLMELTVPNPSLSYIYNKDKDNKYSSMNIHTNSPHTSSYTPVTLIPIKGDVLTEWYRSDLFIKKAVSLLNIPPHDIGDTFFCVLPNHSESEPSASLYRQDSGHVLYRDWHEKSCIAWLTLAEVYASQHYGQVRKLPKPEQATWQIRMLVECGFIQQAKVPKVKLPDGLAQSTIKLYEGFLFLLGCKWLHSPNQPTVFAKSFACAWSETSNNLFKDSLNELLEIGAIVQSGTHNEIKLYNAGGFE